MTRYGALLLLSAWFPVVLGLAHLCLQKTDSPISLVQALVGTLLFPFVQPVLYIRLLLLHQVLLLHNFIITLHMVQKNKIMEKLPAHGGRDDEDDNDNVDEDQQDTEAERCLDRAHERRDDDLISIYNDIAECVCVSFYQLPVVFTSKNMSVCHEN